MSRLLPLLSKLILRRTQDKNRHNKGRQRKAPTQLTSDVLLDVLTGVDYNTLLAMRFSCAGFNKYIASRQRSLPNVLEFRLEICFDPFVHSWIDRRTPKDEIRLLRARLLNDPELFDDGSLDVVPLSASNWENPRFNKLTDVLGYTSHATRDVQSRRMTMSRIKQIIEGCVITHLCLHMRPDVAVDEIVDSVPLLRYVEFLMLCQASPMSRSEVEALLPEHVGNLRRLVIYNLYDCTNWQKFLSIPAIQKLDQLEIHQKSSPKPYEWERNNVLFSGNTAIEDEFFRYCLDFSRLCEVEAKLNKSMRSSRGYSWNGL